MENVTIKIASKIACVHIRKTKLKLNNSLLLDNHYFSLIENGITFSCLTMHANMALLVFLLIPTYVKELINDTYFLNTIFVFSGITKVDTPRSAINMNAIKINIFLNIVENHEF